ncbi:11362_t:CDS:10, partial [Funneliformis caledonium]
LANKSIVVYDLADMKLESSAKRIESNNNVIRKYNRNSFSIDRQKLQLCFTRGQSVEIYFMENGLEIASRNFKELEKIYYLEFIENDEKLLLIGSDEENNQKIIVWDLYNTDKIEALHLDKELMIQNFDSHLARTSGNLLKVDDKGNVTSVLKMIENKLKKETREEIFHEDLVEYITEIEKEPIFKEVFNAKEKEKLPNQGNVFLEFIWTNGIPVKQENKVNSYEEKMKNMEVIKGKSLKRRIVKWEDINENIKGIRYSCKALEHLNKRASSLADDLEPFDNDEESKDIEEILPKNDMELAIYHCKGRELRDTIMVAYLLEYYSRHAKDYAGWMSTVSKSLPLLYKYDYDDYTRKLFRKECFADQNHFSAQDSHEIIPKKYSIQRSNNPEFIAFKPIDKLKSDRESYNSNWKAIKSVKHKMSLWLENFDNANGKPPLALRVVPLPGFITHTIKAENVNYYFRKNLLNIIWFMFLPRWYKISRNEKDKLSPFSRVIRYENNDDMFDNPATEALGIYAIYFFTAKMIQLHFYGVRKFFSDTFNYFDICSVLIPVIVMTIMLVNSFDFSESFGSILAVDSQLVIGISFSILLIWIEVSLPLRIQYPGVDVKTTTISGVATSENTNEVFNVQLVNDYDRTNRIDNPYSYFSTALEASYFWINGQFVQRDDFDSWAVEAFTLLASIMLVTVLQNILIAIMGGVYGEAATKGRQALLRFRANQIADYEALHHIHFRTQEPEPKYIYYIGQAKNFEEWYKSRKGDRGPIYKEFEEKSTFKRYNFKESNFDKVSIWKFDDKPKKDKKEGKVEKSLKSSQVTDIDEESSKGKHSAQDTIEKDHEAIDREIQEIEQLRRDMNSLVDKLLGKLNNQKFNL